MGQFVAPGSGGLANPIDLLFVNGNLFVTSGDTDKVLRYDGLIGGFLETLVSAGANGINRPTDIVERDGLRYISALDSGDVHRYNLATGAFVDKFVTGLVAPAGITFGPDGNLYVGEFATGANNAVFRYSPTGAFLGEFIPAGTGSLTFPNGIEFGPDGNLYVVQGGTSTSRVLRFNGQTGTYLNDLITTGQGGIQSAPRLLFHGNQILLNNQETDQVMRYDIPAWAAFTVSLNAPANEPVSVNYTTASGTAFSGSDFVGTSGTITFAPGQTSRTILIQTLDDTGYEITETFTVNLTSPIGGVIVYSQGVGTIIDNDPQPTKFYVVDDGSANKTFEYGATGTAIENYTVSSGNSAPRGAASTAAGDKVWVVDANKKVYVYNTSGGLLGSWTAGSLASNADVQGITTNGTDVWIVDNKGDKVYRYAGAASRLSGNQTAASSFSLNGSNTSPTDLVTDGSSIWVVNNSSTDKVFKYTLGGSLLGSWTISSAGGSPTGITLDPASVGNLWIVDSNTDRVYQFDAAAGRMSGSQSPSTSFALSAGNSNPQGIADPPPGRVQGSGTLGVPGVQEDNDGANDAALLAIVGELEGLLGGKKRK